MSERVLLPTIVQPDTYDIQLTPNFDDFSFQGFESVSVKVTANTATIELHALDVQINKGVVKRDDAVIATMTDVQYVKETERATLTFDQPITAGDATLELHFVGELNDKMAGFYRSKYKVGDEERYMATTQFEPTDARRAFPCWDEPAVKAKFRITLVVPAHLEALSNMPGKVTASDDKTKTFAFEETPIMSTYLVAFVVGEFEYVEMKTAQTDVLMRVYTPLGKKEQGQFALECGAKILDYYTDYFGVAYPLPKCDMIAIADFSAGAMENWGLITYRETALLIDAKNSGLSSKQRVAYVVAHELAHQWFGNLVTMEWWKELWLNEGFATFVGNQATDFLFPEWDIWTSFVSDYTNRALGLDSLENSHPIEVEVQSSSQVNEIFDAISYCKGAAVIRMIADYVGEQAMKDGLNAYLKEHAYKNAVTTDLWRALSKASGKDVASFMSRWTVHVGYPFVTVARDGDDKSKFKISQERFLASGRKVEADGNWALSVRVAGSGDKKALFEMGDAEKTVELKEVADADWLKFNAGQAGFYHVLYSEELLNGLSKAVGSLSLSSVDRLSVQADAFSLAQAGRLDTAAALKLALAYQNETVLAVWSDLSASIGAVAGVWQDDPAAKGIAAMRRKLYADVGKRLGWQTTDKDGPLDALLRPIVLSALVKADDEATIAEAKKQFEAYADAVENDKEQESPLSVDLRSTFIGAAIKHGGEAEWNRVLALYRKSDMQEEKIRLMRALGSTKNDELRLKTLNWGFTDDVRNQDLFYVIAACAASSRDQTWQFVKDNWAEFVKRFGEGQFLMARIVSLATKGFASEEKAAEIEQFFKENECKAAARTIQQSLEAVRAKAAWYKRDRASVAKWLAAEGFLEGFVSGVH